MPFSDPYEASMFAGHLVFKSNKPCVFFHFESMRGRYTVNEDASRLSITMFMTGLSHPTHESANSKGAPRH